MVENVEVYRGYYLSYDFEIINIFWLCIASCAISSAEDIAHFDERADLYMQTIKKYSEVVVEVEF